MKTELEEAAESSYNKQINPEESYHECFFHYEDKDIYTAGFLEGVDWEAKKSYSEEDMQEYAKFCIRCYNKGLPCIIAKDWFEQFKK